MALQLAIALLGSGSKRKAVNPHQATHRPIRNTPKPAWVLAELIRLKALAPQAGVRMIAEMFNRKFETKRGNQKNK